MLPPKGHAVPSSGTISSVSRWHRYIVIVTQWVTIWCMNIFTHCISGSRMSFTGGWSGGAASAGQESTGRPEMRPSKEHAQAMHSKPAAPQKPLAATEPQAALRTEAAVVPQSILAEKGDAQGPVRVQLWRDTVSSFHKRHRLTRRQSHVLVSRNTKAPKPL